MSSIVLLGVVLLSHSYLERSCTFLFGMLLGARSDDELRQIARGLSTRIVVSFYLLLIVAFASIDSNWSWFSPIFSVSITMLFLKACYDEGPLHWLFTRLPLRFVGNISYSLYLTHSVAIPTVDVLLRPSTWGMHPLVNGAVFFLLALGLSLVLSIGLFATVERWHFRKAARPLEQADIRPRIAA